MRAVDAAVDDAAAAPATPQRADDDEVDDLLRRLAVLEAKKAAWTSQARSLVTASSSAAASPRQGEDGPLSAWEATQRAAQSRWLTPAEARAALTLPRDFLAHLAQSRLPHAPASGTLVVLLQSELPRWRQLDDGYPEPPQVAAAALGSGGGDPVWSFGDDTEQQADVVAEVTLFRDAALQREDPLWQRRAYRAPGSPAVLVEYRFDPTGARPWSAGDDEVSEGELWAALQAAAPPVGGPAEGQRLVSDWWARAAERRSRNAQAAVLAMEQERRRRAVEDGPGSEAHSARVSGARRLSADIRAHFSSASATEAAWREGWATVQAVEADLVVPASPPRSPSSRDRHRMHRAQQQAVRRERERETRDRRDVVDLWRSARFDRRPDPPQDRPRRRLSDPTPEPPPASSLLSYDDFRAAHRRPEPAPEPELEPEPEPEPAPEPAPESAPPPTLQQARLYRQLAVEAERRRQRAAAARRKADRKAVLAKAARTEQRRQRRVAAAVQLQRVARGGAARARLRVQRAAAQLLAVVARVWLRRRRRARLAAAVARLVAARRGRLQRAALAAARAAAGVLQRLARAWLARRRRPPPNAPLLAALLRGHRTRRLLRCARVAAAAEQARETWRVLAAADDDDPDFKRALRVQLRAQARAVRALVFSGAEFSTYDAWLRRPYSQSQTTTTTSRRHERSRRSIAHLASAPVRRSSELRPERVDEEAVVWPERAADARPRLDVQIVEARDLPRACDPFVELTLRPSADDAQPAASLPAARRRRTPPARQTRCPQWRHACHLPLGAGWRTLVARVEVVDDDRFSDAPVVGLCSIPLALLTPGQAVCKWYPLSSSNRSGGHGLGELHVRLRMTGTVAPAPAPAPVAGPAPAEYKPKRALLKRLGSKPPPPAAARRKPVTFEKLDWSKVEARTDSRRSRPPQAARAAPKPPPRPLDLSHVKSRVDSRRASPPAGPRHFESAAELLRVPPPPPAPAPPRTPRWDVASLERTLIELEALHPVRADDYLAAPDAASVVPVATAYPEHDAGAYLTRFDELEVAYRLLS